MNVRLSRRHIFGYSLSIHIHILFCIHILKQKRNTVPLFLLFEFSLWEITALQRTETLSTHRRIDSIEALPHASSLGERPCVTIGVSVYSVLSSRLVITVDGIYIHTEGYYIMDTSMDGWKKNFAYKIARFSRQLERSQKSSEIFFIYLTWKSLLWEQNICQKVYTFK